MYFLTLPDSNNQGKREEAFHWRESGMNRKAGNAGLPVCMPYIETQIWEEEAPWVVGEGEITAKKPAIRLYSGHRCVTPLASGWRSLNWAQNRQTEIGWERGKKVCVWWKKSEWEGKLEYIIWRYWISERSRESSQLSRSVCEQKGRVCEDNLIAALCPSVLGRGKFEWENM